MIIEILYSNVAMLYGDIGNVRLLQQALPNANFIFTQYPQVPTFVKKDVDMIVMGGASEAWQLRIIEKLLPYKKRIEELIEQNVVFLITSNGLDCFGQSIEDENQQQHQALGIFDFNVKVDQMKRVNDRILGTFKDMIMVGFKSQFSQAYGDNQNTAFIRVSKGFGFNQQSKFEGIQYKQFYGTHCIGPILVLNPLFTTTLLEQLTKEKVVLPYFDQMIEAYKKRIIEFNDPKKTHND